MESVNAGVNRITLKEFELTNTSAATFPGATEGKAWSVKDFERKLDIQIIRKQGMDLEFDLIGVDPSLANAFRRILLSEVPSMAIEKVHIYNNTSIIQDEVLAHRLGLIPLKGDPRHFEWKSAEEGDEGTGKTTLEFELKLKCKKNPQSRESDTNPDDLYIDHKVYTKHIKWVPKDEQQSLMSDPGPVEDDILIAKLRPGHELDLKLFAVKGLGRDHAKFSPVSTVFYRLLPEITLTRRITGDHADLLQKCFSPGVIEVKEKNGEREAVVADARYDSCSRNVLRYEELKDSVVLGKVKDHFIFTVESVGAVEPEELFVQAVDVLVEKCDAFIKELDVAVDRD